MDITLSADQLELQAAVTKLLDRYRVLPSAEPVMYVESEALERDLLDTGYLDIARTEGYGMLDAVLFVAAVAQLPYTVEVAASALVAPLLSDPAVPRPLALSRSPLAEPVRFLSCARAIVVDTGSDVRLLDPQACKVSELQTQFAYPLGRFDTADLQHARVLDGVTPERLRQRWRLGLAAEALGCMQAAIDLTVQYLKDRRQFGRPIGSFQALQHRIAECVVLLESLRTLTLKAACTDAPGDAALAAFYAQQIVGRIVMECQQMHGATGGTLEYPLHFWTYRLKALQGELGGWAGQADAAIEALWHA